MHETGDIYYMRARYYDASVGRFISEDPTGSIDGPNLFTYTLNNPINFVDPLGLYKYETTNVGMAFLHESNPFNSDSAMRQQLRSWLAFYSGDWASAAVLSGQSIIEKTNKCGERSGWQNWYTGAQIGTGVFATAALGLGAAEAAGLIDTAPQAGNIIRIISKQGQWGYRIDKPDLHKPFIHQHFWRW